MLAATWFVLAGMGIVFTTLGVLMLVMSLLGRWLKPEPAAQGRAGGRPGA